MSDDAPVLATARLELHRAVCADGPFLLALLNDPDWLRYIGDRGVRSLADAEAYVRDNLQAHYRAHGYGLYRVRLRSGATPIGLCGLLRRDFLVLPDLGFALLPSYVGHGYAAEAARGVIAYARRELGIERLCAIARPDNERSLRLLGRLGFRYVQPQPTPGGEVVALHVNG